MMNIISSPERHISPTEQMNVIQAQQQHELKLADMYAHSTIVPTQYRGKPGDIFVAMQISKATGLDVFYTLNNLYVVNGRPSWSSQAIIALINNSGLFSTRLQWKLAGEGDKAVCTAFATDKASGEVLEANYAIATAKAEGLFKKTGSKWLTMPGQMLKYRAASSFGRLYCPDVLSGLYSVEETREIQEPIRIDHKEQEDVEDLL